MISFATKHKDPEAKLGWGERIGYGSGNFGMNCINAVLGSFLTIYFTNVALLDAGIIASIIAVSKIFDGISDLIVGNMVDRTHSKYGKGRVWLIRMCIPFAISTVLLFSIPQSFPEFAKYVYVFILYNLVNAVFFTAMLVPYFSMISLITRNPYERGMLGNVQQICSTAANVLINSIFIVMLTKFSSSTETIYTQQAFTITMTILSAVMVIISLFCVFSTKERVVEEVSDGGKEKSAETNPIQAFKALITNRYWVILFLAMFVIFFVIIMYSVGNIYYSQYIFGDMSRYPWMSNAISIAQFAVMFATPFFMSKFGKSKIYIAGLGCMILGFAGFGLFAGNLATIVIFNALKGIGLGMSGGMAMGMVADTITYSKIKSGINPVGMGNAAISAAQKLGLGLGTAVFGWVMSGAGFDASLDLAGKPQPDTVVTAIQFMYNWIPVIMCGIVFIALLFLYDIDKKLPELEAAAERDSHQ